MLTREAIMDHALVYFNMHGFEIVKENQSSDLVLKKEDEIIKVIALSAVNSLESACIKGKGFNKQQVKINLGNALYEVSKQKTLFQNTNDQYIFVIPETKIYARIIKEIIVGIKILDIKVFVISDVGQVEEFK